MLIPRRRYRAEELDRLIPKAQKPFPGLKAEKEAAAWARLKKENSENILRRRERSFAHCHKDAPKIFRLELT